MSISYFKNIPVVFLVQEGDELPRTATEEDFLRAGYVPAAGHGFEQKDTEVKDVTAEEELSSCEDCVFLGEDHILIDLVTLPNVDGLLDPFKGIGVDVKNTLEDVKDTVSELFKPLFSYAEEDKAKDENPATKAKTSPVEDFAGDLFTGAFSVFNTVKNGLSGLLDSIDDPKPAKPDTKETPSQSFKDAPFVGIFEDEFKTFAEGYDSSFIDFETANAPKHSSEPAPEADVPVEEKPEFNEFEQTVINKFDEMGLGADARAAMRKSKEFSEFLSSNKPTAEQAKAFADLLKNGKPPFFGG